MKTKTKMKTNTHKNHNEKWNEKRTRKKTSEHEKGNEKNGKKRNKNKKHENKTKRVREKAPFDNFQGQFWMQRRKHSQTEKNTMKENEKGSRKSSFWYLLIISKDNFQGKGRKNNKNNTETKQNEKKRKGFEKKILVAIPKDQGSFSKQRKGRKNRNEKTMKKLNWDKEGVIIFNPTKWWSKWKKWTNKKDMISSPWLAEMNIRVNIYSRVSLGLLNFLSPTVQRATARVPECAWAWTLMDING